MEEDFFFRARGELKRADHLIYVSLKYTRTVDVIKNIIERLISTYDIMMEYLLTKLKEEEKIDEIPMAAKTKVEKLMEIYPDNKRLSDYFESYLFLRKLNKARFKRRREYRVNVTMICHFENEECFEMNIEKITEQYNKTQEFFDYVRGGMEEPSNDAQ
jgi:hypothetical protein